MSVFESDLVKLGSFLAETGMEADYIAAMLQRGRNNASAAETIARDWISAETADPKRTARICQIARVAGNAIGRSRLMLSEFPVAADRAKASAEGLLSAVHAVEAGGTPASVRALAELCVKAIHAALRRVEEAGHDTNSALHSDLFGFVDQLQTLTPEEGRNPMPTIGIVGLLTKAVRLLPNLLPSDVQAAPEFTFDALLCISIVRSISEGKYEQSRVTALTAFAYLYQVVSGGVVLWDGNDAEQDRADGLDDISDILDESGLSVPPYRYRYLDPEMADEALDETELEIELVGQVGHEPAYEPHLPGNPVVEESSAVERPVVAAARSKSMGPEASRKVWQNFLKAFVVSYGRTDAGRAATSMLNGVQAWPGKESFASTLQQAGIDGFARVCLALGGE